MLLIYSFQVCFSFFILNQGPAWCGHRGTYGPWIIICQWVSVKVMFKIDIKNDRLVFKNKVTNNFWQKAEKDQKLKKIAKIHHLVYQCVCPKLSCAFTLTWLRIWLYFRLFSSLIFFFIWNLFYCCEHKARKSEEAGESQVDNQRNPAVR